ALTERRAEGGPLCEGMPEPLALPMIMLPVPTLTSPLLLSSAASVDAVSGSRDCWRFERDISGMYLPLQLRPPMLHQLRTTNSASVEIPAVAALFPVATTASDFFSSCSL